jgi:4-hydroxybenzoate polyprenyltransferase
MKSIKDFLEFIKFEHTVFALPFAYLGMVLAANGWPTWYQFAWITIAMGSARTLAMGTNRLADRWIDAQNPRTANRPLIQGTISVRNALIGTIISGIVLAIAAWQLGPFTFRLLPGAYLFLIGYSFTKHFTWLSHFILGFTDGLAVMGAWAAIRGSLFTYDDLPAWILLATVTLWIGGFDIIYACQDVQFDRQNGLQSIPARFGIPFALRLSSICHFLPVLLLLGLGLFLGYSWLYWIGMTIIVALLIWEHLLLSILGSIYLN